MDKPAQESFVLYSKATSHWRYILGECAYEKLSYSLSFTGKH